ncbi:MAG: phenylacyl-CoA dehydrogenase [Candidatus Pelagadaptatus aseana]|uniref:acyl-CoA dehydrogenase C-terminal domain-containing protein n=1 Tax=Candidatus Pelagadaptatus aseana TaxID=3120508 RepID=UPI0039B2AFEC
MTSYQAPLRDIHFSAFELHNFADHYRQLPGAEDLTPELCSAILEESAKFAETVLAPINSSGDLEGARWHNGLVTTPKGFKQAFAAFAEGGWMGLSYDEQYGGQGLPKSLETLTAEMRSGANMTWSLCPSLAKGAIDTLKAWGTEAQKQTWLAPIIQGRWTATMCLTEAHSGTDLGLLKTRATPQADGSYRISGSKIFITFGDHDWTDNIVHLVLAKLPDAPKGSKGISLFIVPKFQLKDDGTPGQANNVSCGSIETKMGLHASPTCVMNFDDATGYLLGNEHGGLQCMFTFMNTMRLGTGAQGVIHSQIALQKSQQYARERLQMRSLTGIKNPEGAADPIVVHPDVRRMLLTQKAIAEGGRLFVHYMAKQSDLRDRAQCEKTREQADQLLSFLTPIGKAFLTELGLEAASLGIQCFGGHGYIHETGVEQNLRDARIATLYEGTTGIQALDLLGRKVLGSGGQLLGLFTRQVQDFCQQPHPETIQPLTDLLNQHCQDWATMTQAIAEQAMANADEVGAASFDYLMYSGYTILAFFWAQAAELALEKIETGDDCDGFYQAKLETARFYYARLLPRAQSHRSAALAGADSLMKIAESGFCF